jgi:hypothetical protein
MTPEVAIILCVVVFLATWIHLCIRDFFFGGAYLWIFIYTIFTQVGYHYRPDLSADMGLYFGAEVFPEYVAFVTASFVALYLGLLFAIKFFRRKPVFRVQPIDIPGGRFLLYCVLSVYLGLLAFLFWFNYGSLDYSYASDEVFLSGVGAQFYLFIVLFKLLAVTNGVLYAVLRDRVQRERSHPAVTVIFLVFGVTLLGIVSVRIGSRTDPLAFLLVVVMTELQIGLRRGRLLRTLLIILALGLTGGTALTYILRVRGGGNRAGDWQAAIIANDYFVPSHMLIAAIAFDFHDPVKVMKSNAGNTLMKMNQPYLQAVVTDQFNAGLATRSSSFAFFVFTEGYMFGGRYWGVLYNGFVIALGLALWRAFAASDNYFFNMVVIAMISSQLANVARSQTSYFLKDIYLLILPGLVVLILAAGLAPEFLIRTRRIAAGPRSVLYRGSS